MELLDLLDHLDAHNVALELNGAGLKAVGSRPAVLEVADELRQHRDLLHADLVGVVTGHLLAFCDTCGAPTITSVKTSSGSARETWPACRDTPGCGGRTQHGAAIARHRPRPCDIAARANCPPPPARPAPPPKVPKSRLLGPRPPWPEPHSPRRNR